MSAAETMHPKRNSSRRRRVPAMAAALPLAILATLTLASRDSAGVGPAGGGTCSDGKEKSGDTAGHCCWAGQVWSTFKCVGVPTSCPKGRKLDAAKEQCALADCPSGMVRPANDRNQCCWPGQAWSRTRATCVGIPKSCPSTHEISGETCASLDLDNDGIPNKLDKCPTEPEDYNGFEDADGCPDEARRAAKVKAEADAEQRARDERARAEREKLEAQQAAERAQREAEERRLAAIAEEEKRRKDEHEARLAEARDKARGRRASGRLCVGWGAVSLAGMGAFLGIGAAQNGRIQAGGFKTASDIQSAATLGKDMNITAGVFGAVGGVLVATGVPLIAVSRDPKDTDVASAPPVRTEITFGPAGLGARGTF